MPKLNVAIVRAKGRVKQAENDLKCLEEILTVLQKIIQRQENAQKKLFSQEDVTWLFQQLMRLSRHIGSLKARRGAMVLRHGEILWKHLSFLEKAITNLVPEGNNNELRLKIAQAIFQANDIKLLHERCELIAAAENEICKDALQSHRALEHQHNSLKNLKDYLLKKQKQLIHYKKMCAILQSIIGNEIKEDNSDFTPEEKKELQVKLDELQKYITENNSKLPNHIKNFMVGAFTKPNKSDFKNLKILIERQQNFLSFAIENMKKQKQEVEKGHPKIAPDNFTTLMSIVKNIENIIMQMIPEGKEDKKSKEDKYANAEVDFLTLRNTVFEYLMRYKFFLRTGDEKRIKRLIDFIKNFLNSDHLPAAKNGKLLEILTTHREEGHAIIVEDYPIEANKEALKKIRDVLNKGWLGVKNYQKNPEKKRTPEEVLKDFIKKLKALHDSLSSLKSNSMLEKDSSLIQQVGKLIDSITRDNIEESVISVNKLIDPTAYYIEMLDKLVGQFDALKKLLGSKKSKNASTDRISDVVQNMLDVIKILLIMSPGKGILSIIESDDFGDIKTYQQVLLDLQKCIIEFKPSEDTQLEPIASNIAQLKQLLDQQKAKAAKSSISQIEVEKQEENLQEIMKQVKKDETKEPTNKGITKVNIVTLARFISYQLDRENLKVMIDNIKILLSKKTMLDSQEEVEQKNIFIRSFIKSLIVLGESAKDLSFELKKGYNSPIWKILNKTRNFIFHQCMDDPVGRQKLLKFLNGEPKDTTDLNLKLIQKCLGDLEVVQRELEEMQNNLTLKAICENKPIEFDILPPYQINHTLSEDEKKQKLLKRTTDTIASFNKLESKSIKANIQYKWLAILFEYFKEPHAQLKDTIDGLTIVIPPRLPQTEDHFAFTKNESFQLFVLKKLKEDTEQKPKKEDTKKDTKKEVKKGIKIHEPDINIIASFTQEIENLKKLLDVQLTTLVDILKTSREFSIAYCGELSRLLKDNSKTFQNYASIELLTELEDLIVKRGAIAHSSVIKASDVQFNTYKTIVYYLKLLLKIADKISPIITIDVVKLAEIATQYKAEFNLLKDRIGKNPRCYLDLKKIKPISDLQSKSLSTIADLYNALKFYSDKGNLIELKQICLHMQAQQDNVIKPFDQALSLIKQLSSELSELKIELLSITQKKEHEEYSYSMEQQKAIESFFTECEHELKHLHYEVNMEKNEAIEIIRYCDENINFILKNIDEHLSVLELEEGPKQATKKITDFTEDLTQKTLEELRHFKKEFVLPKELKILLEQRKELEQISSTINKMGPLLHQDSGLTMEKIYDLLNDYITASLGHLLDYDAKYILLHMSEEKDFSLLANLEELYKKFKELAYQVHLKYEQLKTVRRSEVDKLSLQLKSIDIEKYKVSKNPHEKEFAKACEKKYENAVKNLEIAINFSKIDNKNLAIEKKLSNLAEFINELSSKAQLESLNIYCKPEQGDSTKLNSVGHINKQKDFSAQQKELPTTLITLPELDDTSNNNNDTTVSTKNPQQFTQGNQAEIAIKTQLDLMDDSLSVQSDSEEEDEDEDDQTVDENTESSNQPKYYSQQNRHLRHKHTIEPKTDNEQETAVKKEPVKIITKSNIDKKNTL